MEQCSAHTEAMERVSAAETKIDSLAGRMKNTDKKFDNLCREVRLLYWKLLGTGIGGVLMYHLVEKLHFLWI